MNIDIRVVLQYTFNAPSASEQKAAEAELYARFLRNPSELLMTMAMLITDESTDQVVRQQAGTVLSRYIFFKNDQTVLIWSLLSTQQIQQIKSQVISGLGTDKELPRRSACDVISKIAVLEFPNNKWPGLITLLLQAASSTDPQFKKTAVMALGFLCTELKQNSILISTEDCKLIFGVVYLGIISESSDIKKESLLALSACTIYMGDVMKEHQFRFKMIGPVSTCLNDVDLCQYALQFFIQYAKNHFGFLKQIAEPLYQKTVEIIKLCNNFSITAMELWATVAEIQLINKKAQKENLNIIKPFLQELLGILFIVLTVVDKDEDNNFREAAFRTLVPLCETYPDQCIQRCAEYSASCLNSQNWKQKQCANLVFSAISGFNTPQVTNYLASGIEMFFSILGDEDEFVVESNLIGLVKILQSYGGKILRRPNYNQFINILSLMCKKHEGEILNKTIQCLGKIVGFLDQSGITHKLAHQISPLVLDMTTLLHRQPQIPLNTMQSVSIVLIHLVQGNVDQKIGKQFLDYTIEELEKNPMKTQQEMNIKFIHLIVLHTCILSSTAMFSENLISRIINVLVKHFQSISSIDVDGVFVIGALAFRSGQKLSPFYHYLQPYINYMLDENKDPSVARIAPGVLGDIARALGSEQPNEANKFFNYLYREYNQNLDRETKVHIIGGLGDLIRDTHNSQVLESNIKSIWYILDFSVKACITLINGGNPDDVEYIDELRDSLREFLESLTSCQFKGEYSFMTSLLQTSMLFFVNTCNRNANPSMHYFRKTMYVLLDIGSLLLSTHRQKAISQLTNIFNIPEFISLWNEMKTFQADEDLTKLQSYGRGVLSNLNIRSLEFV